MSKPVAIARSEFILGGQKSGKSRRAQNLAADWLARSPAHRAVLVATAQACDAEMQARIARHQQDRAKHVPGMLLVAEPLALAQALTQHSTPQTLVLIDCLTVWLTNCWMQAGAFESHEFKQIRPETLMDNAQAAMLLIAIEQALGPVVLVGNEIGLGVIPMGDTTRAFVDALGNLNQAVAQACERVTLMAAGLPLTLKEPA